MDLAWSLGTTHSKFGDQPEAGQSDCNIMSSIPETQYFHHGPLHVSGGTIPNAVTAYRVHGDPTNPCIVLVLQNMQKDCAY